MSAFYDTKAAFHVVLVGNLHRHVLAMIGCSFTKFQG